MDSDAFINACGVGDAGTVRSLLLGAPTSVLNGMQSSGLGKGHTGFLYACKRGRTSILRLLLADERIDVLARLDGQPGGATGLGIVCHEGGNIVAATLLANCDRIDPNFRQGTMNVTAFHIACLSARSSIAMVDALLRNPRVDVNLRDDRGYTACESVYYQYGHSFLINRLLAHRRILTKPGDLSRIVRPVDPVAEPYDDDEEPVNEDASFAALVKELGEPVEQKSLNGYNLPPSFPIYFEQPKEDVSRYDDWATGFRHRDMLELAELGNDYRWGTQSCSLLDPSSLLFGPSTVTLEAFPDELLLGIFSRLVKMGLEELLQLARLSRRLREVAFDPALWRDIVLMNGHQSTIRRLDMPWTNLYTGSKANLHGTMFGKSVRFACHISEQVALRSSGSGGLKKLGFDVCASRTCGEVCILAHHHQRTLEELILIAYEDEDPSLPTEEYLPVFSEGLVFPCLSRLRIILTDSVDDWASVERFLPVLLPRIMTACPNLHTLEIELARKYPWDSYLPFSFDGRHPLKVLRILGNSFRFSIDPAPTSSIFPGLEELYLDAMDDDRVGLISAATEILGHLAAFPSLKKLKHAPPNAVGFTQLFELLSNRCLAANLEELDLSACEVRNQTGGVGELESVLDRFWRSDRSERLRKVVYFGTDGLTESTGELQVKAVLQP